jgi:hypothetical protein
MLKNLRFYLIAATMASLFSGAALDAQNLATSESFREGLGTVVADTVRWFGSGATDATTSRHVDTLFSTGRDTSYAVNIAGAESVILELLTRPAGGADSVNVVYSFQVASSGDRLAMWHTLNTTVAGGGTGKLTNSNDTDLVILSSSSFNDTAVNATGITTMNATDQALVFGSRKLRVIMRSLSQAADSQLVVGIPTIRYPR